MLRKKKKKKKNERQKKNTVNYQYRMSKAGWDQRIKIANRK